MFRSLKEEHRSHSPMSERSASEHSFSSAADQPLSPMHVQESLETKPETDSDDNSIPDSSFDSPRPSRQSQAPQEPIQPDKDASPSEDGTKGSGNDEAEKEKEGEEVIRNSTLANAAGLHKKRGGSILESSSGKITAEARKKRGSLGN